MAPLPACFRSHPNDSKKVYCTICSPGNHGHKYIATKSANDHIKSGTHRKAIERFQQARTTEARIREKQAAEIQAQRTKPPELRNINLSEPSIQHVNDFQESSQPPPEFWRNANHNLGISPAEMEVDEEKCFQKEIDSVMGGWKGRLADALATDSGNREALLLEAEEEQLLADMMANTAIRDDALEQALYGSMEGFNDPDWYPYDSKTMCILDVLDNLPRLRISDSLMKMFIWAMKECGVSDVPSFYALRKKQKDLREAHGIPSFECKSVQGKIFYINDIRRIIAQDYAHPDTRTQLHLYPEIPEDGIITEVWHAEKWRKDMDLNILSPMFDAGGSKHYYVFELLRLKDQSFIIPIRWVTFKNKVHADVFVVTIDSNGVAHVEDSQTVLVCIDKFDANYLDLQDEHALPQDWSAASVSMGYPSKMPNRYRELAGGDPLYVSFVDLFGDDVSGNRSKSWNKHENTYATHRNLPRKTLQQEYHIHLISTSQFATIPEQYYDIKKIIDSTHQNPVQVPEKNGTTTRFMIRVHAEPSDNPAQSNVASHIGGAGNHPCRKCEMGGSEEDRSSDVGFHAIFKPGKPRTRVTIKRELEQQIDQACRGAAIKTISQRQTDSGTKDGYTQYWIDELLKRHKAMKHADPESTNEDIYQTLLKWVSSNSNKIYNPFLLTDGFDPAKDTPVEILHTILLGVVKYNWHASHTKWSDDTKKRYSQRLQATDTGGLSIHAIRASYIIQFAGSLIGRQLKTIVQTAPFHVHDIVSEDHFKAWKALGCLSALLWHVEIEDMDQYCNDIRTAVANVQDMFAMIDPTKILRKIKNHLLGHLVEDIRRFGPLLGVITESFESFNGVFRNCSVLSNHLAPSRDIARQTSDQESMKHRLTGGQWIDETSNEFNLKMAGQGVLGIVTSKPIIRTMLGWTDPTALRPGSVIKHPLGRKPKSVTAEAWETRYDTILRDTPAKDASNQGSYDLNSIWTRAKVVISVSGDECSAGAWVFYRSPLTQTVAVGRIKMILTKHDDNLVIIEEFQIASQRHEFFDLPYLFRRQREVSFAIIPCMNVLFIQNVQHDCRKAECEASGQRQKKQERQESEETEAFVEHKTDDYFLINLYAFHNAHLVRRVLPRDLAAPIPLFPNRQEKHEEIAKNLRETLWGRKEENKRKREERKAKKGAEKAEQAEKAPVATMDEDSGIRTGKRQQPEQDDVDEMDSSPTRKRRRG